MKKYLSALALGGLLCSASIAYGTDQPVIDQINQPATETQDTIKKSTTTDQVITRAEFTALMVQSTGSNIDTLIDERFSANQPINFAEALDLCGIIANPFEDANIDDIGLADGVNLIDEAFITPQEAETMLNNLALLLELEQNEKNKDGVSYAVSTLEDGYKLELLWGKKPSSGYNIEIEETKTVGDTLYVNYVTSEPKPGAAYLTVITYPSDSVAIEANKLPKRVVIINNN